MVCMHAIIVWAVWLLLIAAAFGVPVLTYQSARSNGPHPAATQPVDTAQPAGVASPLNRHVGIVGLLIGGLFVAGLFVLPVVGVVLLILMILGRRTATGCSSSAGAERCASRGPFFAGARVFDPM